MAEAVAAIAAFAAENSAMIAIASTAMQAVGAISQGNARAAQYEQERQAQQLNAQIATQNARYAAQQGAANEEAQRRKAAIIAGEQRAAIAGAGIGNEGTASDLVQQSAQLAEMDALNIRYASSLQQAGFLNQANQATWAADNAGANAESARTSGWMNAGASVLSGMGGYAMNRARIKAAQNGALQP